MNAFQPGDRVDRPDRALNHTVGKLMLFSLSLISMITAVSNSSAQQSLSNEAITIAYYKPLTGKGTEVFSKFEEQQAKIRDLATSARKMAVRLVLEKHVYKRGEPMVGKLTLQNTAEDTASWNLSTGRTAHVILKRIDTGDKFMGVDMPLDASPMVRPGAPNVEVKAGEQYIINLQLKDYTQTLPDGRYTMYVMLIFAGDPRPIVSDIPELTILDSDKGN